MKKFVLLTYGYETPTPEIQEAWGKWFASIGNKMVDPGSPLGGDQIDPIARSIPRIFVPAGCFAPALQP